MATRLYVGNLPYNTTDDELKTQFSAAGNVEKANVIMDKMTGRSRGFGFVEMTSPEEGAKAIEMFNGQDMNGRNLIVNEARPMEQRPAGGGRGGFNRGGRGDFGGGRNDY